MEHFLYTITPILSTTGFFFALAWTISLYMFNSTRSEKIADLLGTTAGVLWTLSVLTHISATIIHAVNVW